MNREDFYGWQLEMWCNRTPFLNIDPIVPPFLLERDKMRFNKKYVGTLPNGDKLFKISDSKYEIPFGEIAMKEKIISETVAWLNKNIQKKSFTEIIDEGVKELWGNGEVITDHCMGYSVITEICENTVTVQDVNDKFCDYEVRYENICFGKNVYWINKPKWSVK